MQNLWAHKTELHHTQSTGDTHYLVDERYQIDDTYLLSTNDVHFKNQKCLNGVTYQYIKNEKDIYDKTIICGDGHSINNMYNEFNIIDKYLENFHRVDIAIGGDYDTDIDLSIPYFELDNIKIKQGHLILVFGQLDKTKNDIYIVDNDYKLILTDLLSTREKSNKAKFYIKLGTYQEKQFFLMNESIIFPISGEEKVFEENHSYIIKNTINYDINNTADTAKILFTNYDVARFQQDNSSLYENINFNFPNIDISFSLYFDVPTNYELTLQQGYDYNALIYWGDGDSDSINISLSSSTSNSSVTHFFEPGFYLIVIKKQFPALNFFNDINIVDMMSWGKYSSTQLTELNFRNSSLVSLPSESSNLKEIISFDNVWTNNANLLIIPDGIFGDNHIITSFQSTFEGCSSIENIPSDIFITNTGITSLISTFKGCVSLSEIPENIFDTNTLITTFYSTFENCSLESIPENLFNYNINALKFNSTFKDNNIHFIPEILFENNIDTVEFNSTFEGNILDYIDSVPNNLFADNINALKFNSTFKNCSKLETIGYIFAQNNIATDFNSTFENCSLLETIHGWQMFPLTAKHFKSTFKDCISLLNFNNLNFENERSGMCGAGRGTEILDFTSTFENCILMVDSDLSNYMFKSNYIYEGSSIHNPIYKFNSTFKGCSSIQNLPSRLFQFSYGQSSHSHIKELCTLNFNSTFENCESLISINMPSNFFFSPKVKEFNSTFKNCISLQEIPFNLFYGNISVLDFSSTFYNCTSLTEIPINLFDNNINIQKFSYTFYNCSSLIGLAPRIWESPWNSVTSYSNCFTYDTGLTNYCEIPSDWEDFDEETINIKLFFPSQTLFSLKLKSGYNFDGEIYWDFETTPCMDDNGEVILYTPTISDENIKHTYERGTYILKLYGQFEALDFTNSTSILEVCSWGNYSQTNLTYINFLNSKLYKLPEQKNRLEHIINFDSSFERCSSLTSIPIGLFDGNVNTTSFNSTFKGSGILYIPSNLFVDNINIEDFSYTFSETNITSIPSGLFDNNVLVEDFSYTFSETNITSIPNNLFVDNINVEDFSYTFSETNITSLSNEMFTGNTLVTDFSGTFSETPLIAIPSNLFNNNILVEDFSYTFYNCSSLIGLEPVLWESPWDSVTAHSNCYSFDIGLSNYCNIPSDWLDFDEETITFKVDIIQRYSPSPPHDPMPLQYTLKLKNGYNFDGKIYWDYQSTPGINDTGEVVSYTPTTSDIYINHTYDSVGVYTIKLYGQFESLDLSQSNVIEVCSWGDYNQTSLKHINFLNSKLYKLPEQKNRLEHIESFYRVFRNTKLTSLPVGIFDGNTTATTFEETFNNCSELISLPDKLFDSNINITDFRKTFSKTDLAIIPDDLFINNTSVTDFSYTFSQNNLTSIPDNLFDNNTLVTDFSYTFSQNNLTSIPDNLFINNSSVTDLSSTFYGNQITSIPDKLFDSITAITSFIFTFGNNQITSIPGNLFDNNTLVTDFTSVFRDNQITSIPDNLFDNNTAVTNFSYMFYNNSLTTIPDNLFDNNILATSFYSTFYNNDLINFPLEIFDNNTAVTDFAFTFYNNISLTGCSAPILWESPWDSVTSKYQCFSYDTGLTNYCQIPNTWLKLYSPTTIFNDVTTNINLYFDEETTYTLPIDSSADLDFYVHWNDTYDNDYTHFVKTASEYIPGPSHVYQPGYYCLKVSDA